MPSPGQPSTFSIKANIARGCGKSYQDARLTVKELSDSVGISSGFHKILT